LTAVVVSQLSKQAIRQALQPYVDEVFLPRKIHFVTAIPRNPAGKLVRNELDKLLAGLH
jgi:acyl-coenzyme A synthetase/AMP-(fatty) acid ligase